jgi:hypothetical protein
MLEVAIFWDGGSMSLLKVKVTSKSKLYNYNNMLKYTNIKL